MSLNQVTKETEIAFANADVIFCLVNNPLSLTYLQGFKAEVRDLKGYYDPEKERRQSYLEMVESVLAEVRNGLNVVFAVYGHPGVYAYPTHVAIKRARAEGLAAVMLPGISAEACLFADLGIDPSWFGCQAFEAMDYLTHRPPASAKSTLILYQVSIVGITSLPAPGEVPAKFEALMHRLIETYGGDHLGTLYESSLFPLFPPRMEEMKLAEMRPEHFRPETTLVILPLDPHPNYQADFEPVATAATNPL